MRRPQVACRDEPGCERQEHQTEVIECRVDDDMQHIAATVVVVRIPGGCVRNDALGEEHESDRRSEHQKRLPQRRARLKESDDRPIAPQQHERERAVA